jgi:hypothetical protein
VLAAAGVAVWIAEDAKQRERALAWTNPPPHRIDWVQWQADYNQAQQERLRGKMERQRLDEMSETNSLRRDEAAALENIARELREMNQ